MEFEFTYRALRFVHPGGTSRGVLTEKPTWILKVTEGENVGYGEVSIIPGLSPDNLAVLHQELPQNPDIRQWDLQAFPAVKFAYETALQSLKSDYPFELYPSSFTEGRQGIRINGLIWMGDKETMIERIAQKLDAGFTCLKLKVGAIDFDAECDILHHIRKSYGPEALEIRLDANGAFTGRGAERLKSLSVYSIHSIEQPVAPRHWEEMHNLCVQEIIPIALDEELIGVSPAQRNELLEVIGPQYLIFKPSLLGGIEETEDWIQRCVEKKIDWWATSALESNIGLNAIAQWAFSKSPALPQGLGTGNVFSNNYASPLELHSDQLWYNSEKTWKV